MRCTLAGFTAVGDAVQDPTTGLESQQFEHHTFVAPERAAQNYADIYGWGTAGDILEAAKDIQVIDSKSLDQILEQGLNELLAASDMFIIPSIFCRLVCTSEVLSPAAH